MHVSSATSSFNSKKLKHAIQRKTETKNGESRFKVKPFYSNKLFLYSLVNLSKKTMPIVSKWLIFCNLVTGSIARSAKRRYISYSEADFEVFRPAGATLCTDGGEIWHGGVDQRSTPRCQISPHRCNDKGIGPQHWNFYWNVTKIRNINAPRGVSLARFSRNLQSSYLVS